MKTRYGWDLRTTSNFKEQFERQVDRVAFEKSKSPETYQTSANSKLLAIIERLIFEIIPQDPARVVYRQGNTMEPKYRHWFRAKFGNGRFQLLFTYDLASKIIVYAWVNDNSSLRAYGAKNDAYAVSNKMLSDGSPPDDWAALLVSSRSVQVDKE